MQDLDVASLLAKWRDGPDPFGLFRRKGMAEQEIVRLRFYEELSQSEIAERVGISQMHVSRLLRRSFEQMRAP